MICYLCSVSLLFAVQCCCTYFPEIIHSDLYKCFFSYVINFSLILLLYVCFIVFDWNCFMEMEKFRILFLLEALEISMSVIIIQFHIHSLHMSNKKKVQSRTINYKWLFITNEFGGWPLVK